MILCFRQNVIWVCASVTNSSSFKCKFCASCNGFGCVGELPGLGGVFESRNFQLNCAAWKEHYDRLIKKGFVFDEGPLPKEVLRCGPVTGAVQNIGFEKEGDFYLPYFTACTKAGIGICVGDGCPDEKLELGVEAVKKLGTKAAFFLKPYPNHVLARRVEMVRPYASYIGMDIDSYNILTMRNLVNLEKKNAESITEFRSHFEVPFVIKGVFTKEDVKLVKEVHPDVVYISNHGGRVETRVGSTADFLYENAQELKNYCSQIWVDGGIRTKEDIQTALALGADKVIAARPFLTALCSGGEEKMSERALKMLSLQ